MASGTMSDCILFGGEVGVGGVLSSQSSLEITIEAIVNLGCFASAPPGTCLDLRNIPGGLGYQPGLSVFFEAPENSPYTGLATISGTSREASGTNPDCFLFPGGGGGMGHLVFSVPGPLQISPCTT